VLDLLHGATPSPAPTVTQTVIVPTSIPTPVITITPPDSGLDPLKDVVFGDFGGAALGAAIAIGVAVWLVRKDREARIDERRRDHGQAFLGALNLLVQAVIRRDDDASHLAYFQTTATCMPLQAGYGDPNDFFHQWLQEYILRLADLWEELCRDSIDTTAIQDHLGEGIAVMSMWINDPEPWKTRRPVDAVSAPPSDTPGTPSPRPSA